MAPAPQAVAGLQTREHSRWRQFTSAEHRSLLDKQRRAAAQAWCQVTVVSHRYLASLEARLGASLRPDHPRAGPLLRKECRSVEACLHSSSGISTPHCGHCLLSMWPWWPPSIPRRFQASEGARTLVTESAATGTHRWAATGSGRAGRVRYLHATDMARPDLGYSPTGRPARRRASRCHVESDTEPAGRIVDARCRLAPCAFGVEFDQVRA
jgi:hypothetical protein